MWLGVEVDEIKKEGKTFDYYEDFFVNLSFYFEVKLLIRRTLDQIATLPWLLCREY